MRVLVILLVVTLGVAGCTQTGKPDHRTSHVEGTAVVATGELVKVPIDIVAVVRDLDDSVKVSIQASVEGPDGVSVSLHDVEGNEMQRPFGGSFNLSPVLTCDVADRPTCEATVVLVLSADSIWEGTWRLRVSVDDQEGLGLPDWMAVEARIASDGSRAIRVFVSRAAWSNSPPPQLGSHRALSVRPAGAIGIN